MGKSNVVNSSNNGYWLDSTPLTSKSDKTNPKFEQLLNTIGRYKQLLKLNSQTTSEIVAIEKITENYKFDFGLPKVDKYYDIYNSKRFSKKIQNWKGVVIQISENSFKAKLEDLSAGGTYEIGEFDYDDVSPDDTPLLLIGAIFYWSVGHYMENGQSVKRSDIRFQRLITLDENDIENVKSMIESKYSNIKYKSVDQ